MNTFLWIIAILFLTWITTRFLKDYKKEIKDELREEIKDELKNEDHKSEDWEDEDPDVGKMFGNVLNEMTDKEMEKLTPTQRAEAEKFGGAFSEEFEKLSPSEQENVWNNFADVYNKQKNKEWHEKWDKKLKEMGVEEGLGKDKRKGK